MKIALVGSGKIVMSCLDALSQADGVTAHALCVLERNLAKAQALQQQYGIQRIYTDYQALLKDTEADFIYLGIPNNQHYAYARDALLANRITSYNVCYTKLLRKFNYYLSQHRLYKRIFGII